MCGSYFIGTNNGVDANKGELIMDYKNPIPEVGGEHVNRAGIGECELCKKDNVIVIGTSFTDCYCRECLMLVISEFKRAIKDIDEYQGSTKAKRISKKSKITIEELTELERLKDEALAKLISGTIYRIK